MVPSVEMRASAWVVLIAEELGCGKSSLPKPGCAQLEVTSVPNLARRSVPFSRREAPWGSRDPMQT